MIGISIKQPVFQWKVSGRFFLVAHRYDFIRFERGSYQAPFLEFDEQF